MAQIETAVILAAGMGIRLGELGRQIPKGFLQLGSQPIVVESIAHLREHGIRQIVIVTGHLAGYYEELGARMDTDIITVHNPRYADSGSMYSLFCARDHLPGDFLLLESDLIYESRALDAVIAFARDNVVLLSGPTGAGDEIYAEAEGVRLVGLSKDRSTIRHVVGELVGISKISGDLFGAMLTAATRAFQRSFNVAYETDTLMTVAQKQPVYYTVVEDLCWSEIDDAHHLARAREQIYPRLVALHRGGVIV